MYYENKIQNLVKSQKVISKCRWRNVHVSEVYLLFVADPSVALLIWLLVSGVCVAAWKQTKTLKCNEKQ